jgi:hypothetical protein
MTKVRDGVGAHFAGTDVGIEPYYAKLVVLPELKVKPEMVRRDSRAYMVPGFDEPPDAIKIIFLVDARFDRSSSRMYTFLNLWRKLVRAGRGAVSRESTISITSDNYRLDYAFDIPLALLRGAALTTKSVSTPSLLPPFTNTRQVVVDGGLEISQQFVLVKAWLAGFKLSDLNYEHGNQLSTLDATLYAEDIFVQDDPEPLYS